MNPARTELAAQHLRLRFGRIEQLHHHLRLVDGRLGLVFFPDPFQRVEPNRPVVCELSIDQPNQSCILRGSAKTAQGGASAGAWLELPTARDVLVWSQGDPAARRGQSRVAVDLLVRVSAGENRAIAARLLDLSQRGARLGSLSLGLQPAMEVAVELMAPLRGWPQSLGEGRVAWARGGEVGLEWRRDTAAARAAATRAADAARQLWVNAIEAFHPPACRCAEGGMSLDPVIPRSLLHKKVSG